MSTSEHASIAEFGWPGGDTPGALEFSHEPPRPLVDALLQSLAQDIAPFEKGGISVRSLTPTDGPAGSYRISGPEESYFVRVTSRTGNPDLERRLIEHLATDGVKVVPPLVSGGRLSWGDREYRVDLFPLIDGRHYNGSLDDLSSIAIALRNCHRALAGFPDVATVREAAASRYRRLDDAKEIIAKAMRTGGLGVFKEHASWAGENLAWLETMVNEYNPRLDTYEEAQCLHGEVHPGNAVFASDDGAAVLVDFEESVHVFAPAAWDLAWLVQRFCLRDNPPPTLARRRANTVAEAYGTPLPALVHMMRQAAWQSVATIVALREFDNVITPGSECEKFAELERQARAYEGVV